MPKYHVATLSSYVIVEAADEDAARVAGLAALGELYTQALRREVPIEIRKIRLATDDEIALDLWNAHQEKANREATRQPSRAIG